MEECNMAAQSTKKDSKGRNLKVGEDQQKNGRYRYRYTDIFGNRKTIYSWRLVKTDRNPSERRSSELSLREMIRNIERDKEDKISTYEANSITVYNLVCRYLESKHQLANATIQNYIQLTEKNIKPTTFGNMIVSNVRKSDVKKFYAYLFNEKKFAASTIQLYQNIIYPSFQLAVDDDIIRKNPSKDCMKDFIGKGLYSAKAPLTRKEQSELLNFIRSDTIYSNYYPLIAFMLGTGCRISETLGLTWNDIDFESCSVSINHQILYRKIPNKKGVAHYASPPKNRTNRIIPLQKEILHIMKQHKKETYFMSKTNDYKIDGYSTFVFLNNQMKIYTPNTITRVLHNIRDAYNKDKYEEDGDLLLPDFSAHTFRHTFCTRMAENGMDVKVLQEIMGHKSIAVTMEVYNHIVDDRVKNEVARVASALVV